MAAALALQQQEGQEGSSARFSLVKCMPTWPRRGVAHPDLSVEQSQCLVRACPRTDATHGFFVACFQRPAQTTTTTKAEKAATTKTKTKLEKTAAETKTESRGAWDVEPKGMRYSAARVEPKGVRKRGETSVEDGSQVGTSAEMESHVGRSATTNSTSSTSQERPPLLKKKAKIALAPDGLLQRWISNPDLDPSPEP